MTTARQPAARLLADLNVRLAAVEDIAPGAQTRSDLPAPSGEQVGLGEALDQTRAAQLMWLRVWVDYLVKSRWSEAVASQLLHAELC